MNARSELDKIQKSVTKLMVAKEEGEAHIKLYTAALMKKNPQEIERTRQVVLTHMEYVLDLMAEVFKEH